MSFKKHFSHYIPLFGVFVFVIAGFMLFSYEQWMLIGISVGACMFYLVWGVVHHTIHKDLSFPVFLEYLGISIIGFILLMSLVYYM